MSKSDDHFKSYIKSKKAERLFSNDFELGFQDFFLCFSWFFYIFTYVRSFLYNSLIDSSVATYFLEKNLKNLYIFRILFSKFRHALMCFHKHFSLEFHLLNVYFFCFTIVLLVARVLIFNLISSPYHQSCSFLKFKHLTMLRPAFSKCLLPVVIFMPKQVSMIFFKFLQHLFLLQIQLKVLLMMLAAFSRYSIFDAIFIVLLVQT